MSQDDESKLVVAALDVAGKVVAGFGLILGLAYLSGWVYWRTYLGYIDVDWVLDIFDAQSLIQAGLPWVAYCLVLSLLIFFGTKTAIHISKFVFWFVLISGVIIALLAGVVVYIKPAVAMDEAWKLQHLFFGVIAAVFIALGFRVLIEDRLPDERPRPKNALAQFSFGLAWMVLANPYMYAYSQVREIQCDEAFGISVVHADEEPGALVAITGGKVIAKNSLKDRVYIYSLGDELIFKKTKLVGNFPGFSCVKGAKNKSVTR